jgi:uncharacterized protein YndB with AHSA1/START domain
MSVVAVTGLVRAPVDRVWSVLTDLPARAEWLSTVYSVELLTPGDFGPGTVWREHRMMPDGDRATEEFRVEECAPIEHFVLSSPGTGADHRLTYTLAPIQTATLSPIHAARPTHSFPLRPSSIVRQPTPSFPRRPPESPDWLAPGMSARFTPGTAVSAVLEGTASGAINRLLALVLGGFAASVVEGALRQDLADLAAEAPLGVDHGVGSATRR